MVATADPQVAHERDRTRIALATVAVGLAVLGFGALVMRPVFPLPVQDVSSWLPPSPSGDAWDRLHLAHGVIAVLRPGLLIGLVASPRGRSLLLRATSWMSDSVVGAALAPVNMLVAVDLVTLPIAWWGRIAREPASAWLTDWTIAHAQTWALVGLFAAGLVLAMRRWPTTWHWRAALAGIALAALVPLAADLDPFAGDLTPLPDGPVRSAVEEGADAAGAGAIPIRVGSNAATAENGAYVGGLGPSRSIVISSELLTFPPDQVAFVAMHEFAHREHHDLLRKVLATATGLVAGLWILRRVLASRWGREHLREAKAPDVRRMIIALVVAAVVGAVAAPISNLATRQSEAAADWRALELTGDPSSAIALQGFLVRQGAADPDPPGWYQVWLATHPSAGDRIGLALRYAQLHDLTLTP